MSAAPSVPSVPAPSIPAVVRQHRRPIALLALVLAVAVASAVVALELAGGAPPDLPPGLSDPGQVAGWSLRLLGPVGLLLAALVTGSLLVAAWLGPDRPAPVRRQVRTAGRVALAWAAVGVVGFVLTVSDATGAPLSGIDLALLLPWAAPASAVAHLMGGLLAAVLSLLALRPGPAPSRRRAQGLLVLALASALPVPLVGHLAGLQDGGVTQAGLVVHVGAALLWSGGLAGLLLHLSTDQEALAVAAPRFSSLASAAYVALAGSGLIAAAAALSSAGAPVSEAWASGYVGLLAAKAAALVLLGGLGLLHRRRTLPRLVAGEPRAFARLAAVELVVMGAGAGLATALTRTPLPAPPLEEGGHAAPETLEELSVAGLLTAWRPQALVLVVLAAALVGYLRARRKIAVAGPAWPRHRTACFVTGLALALLVLCSGVAAYASVLLSVYVAQLLVLLLLVPGLLLLGRPATLFRVTHGRDLPAPFRRALDRPALGAVAACLLITVVFHTPVGALSLGSPWWHLLVLTAAVASGTALWWPVLADEAPVGSTAGSTAGQQAGQQAGWLLTVAACLALLALQLLWGNQLFAAEWFLELRLGWADPVDDQHRAGVVAAVAAGLAVAMAGLAAAGHAARYRSEPGSVHSLTSTRPLSSSSSSAP